jgi:hypothetical protein
MDRAPAYPNGLPGLRRDGPHQEATFYFVTLVTLFFLTKKLGLLYLPQVSQKSRLLPMTQITTIDQTKLTFGVTTDLVPVGQNPEMSEMGNPNGQIIGKAHGIIATLDDGSRWVHNQTAYTYNGYVLGADFMGEFNRDAADENDENDLSRWFVNCGDLTPLRLQNLADYLNRVHPELDDDCWAEVTPAYGSKAYQLGDHEAKLAELEHQAEGF